MKKGDVVTSCLGNKYTVLKVTTKVITVEVERRVLDKRTGELKVEKRTREISVAAWDAFNKAYQQ